MSEKISAANRKYGTPVNTEIVAALCSLYAGGRANMGKGEQDSIGTALLGLSNKYLNNDDKNALIALFLAWTDAPTHMVMIKKSLKHFTNRMMPKAPKVVTLIESIVDLCSPLESQEEENKAYLNACKGFQDAFTLVHTEFMDLHDVSPPSR